MRRSATFKNIAATFQAAPLQYLAPDQMQAIHDASLEILRECGTVVHCEEAVDLLAGAGARVKDGKRVYIPGILVEECIRSAPSGMTIYNRNGDPAMLLEECNVYYGTGSDCPNLLDTDTGERHDFLFQDVVNSVRLVDALPYIDFTMSNGLAAEGIKVLYAGETITPEFSTTIEMLGAACSINITPSHNPSNYLGLKFNPSDGGPAGPEITNYFQDEANRLMGEDGAETPDATGSVACEEIDTVALYLNYIRERGTLDLDKIRDFVRDGDCLIVVDHVHGATRGRPERLLNGSAPGVKDNKLMLLQHRRQLPLWGRGA